MPTYSDICADYTSDPSRYPASVQQQLKILAEYLYFLGDCGNASPFNHSARSDPRGIVATTELTENPDYDPQEVKAEFFTPFEEGELMIKAVEAKIIFQTTSIGGEGATTTSTFTNGVKKSSLIISGDFVDYGVPTIVDDVREFNTTVPVCFLMVLIGNLEILFRTPISEGPSDTYGDPPLVITPQIPADPPETPEPCCWFQDEEPEIRVPYWIVPGEGSSQTLPCITPRRLRIKQWGFMVDKKTTNANDRRMG